jgi:hypothetical protein
MFVNHCTACDKRQLIFPSQFRSVTRAGDGVVVTYTCWCGSEQTWTLDRHVDPAQPTASVAA